MHRFVLLLVLFIVTAASAQQPAPAPPPEPASIATLRALLDSITSLRSDVEELNQKAKATNDPKVKGEADDAQHKLDEAEEHFDSVATQSASDDFSSNRSRASFDLANEFNELVEPLVHELKAATDQPRQIEHLRSQLAAETKRLESAKQAVAHVQKTLESLPKTNTVALKKALQTTLDEWQETERETQGSVAAMRDQLANALAKRMTIWQILSGAIATFFLTRGLNIALAVAVFLLVFFGWRELQRRLLHRLPWNANDPHRPFIARLIEVIMHVFAFVIAAIAVLTVLYWAGDWLLLGLCIVALLALVLAAKNGLPKFYRQARLLMNLGEVREGERVVINGIPWQVRSINMFSELVNPSLKGAILRLPITQLVGMNSRPHQPGDPWFPCKEDDWVQLNDGTFGKAVSITADFVQLVQLGGAHRTYTTTAFLQQSPTRLTNGFRVATIVRIDRAHQAEADEAIPSALKAGVQETLLKIIDASELKSLKVEYRGMPGVALEFDVIADCDGAVADKFGTLTRAVQRGALGICNQRNWRLGG